jgi:hypothetical protein
MVMVYRPAHPDCNENGMVDRCLTYAHVEHNDAPYVVSDTMEPTRHMCDGRTYDSKARFREVTRAHGCVEVGNETSTLLKPRKPIELDRGQRRDDIRRAMHELRNGRRV